MEKNRHSSVVNYVLAIYLVCYGFRAIEYLVIRTDRTIFGEAFIHKSIGIVVLMLALRYLSLTWSDIGFTRKLAGKNTLYGLMLGASVFTIAYAAEFFLQLSKGHAPSLQIYVTSYAIVGNQRMQTDELFFFFCIVGNIINVIMEEGVFRGLFIRRLESEYVFIKAVVFSSILFGIWHIAAPVRSLLDGEIGQINAVASALILVLTTGMTGAKLCLLTKITGSLWAPMADHFFNNTIINLLHITTTSGSDELQMMRISIAQTLSFFLVLFIYYNSKAYNKPTFRALNRYS